MCGKSRPNAQNAMTWYVVYRGKEPRVYALKCLLAVLRSTNEALKYLVTGYCFGSVVYFDDA